MPFLRKYNTLLVTGTTSIRVPIIKRAAVDFALGADWTPAAGDVKVFVDAAAVANITNLPTAIASGNGAFWEFILTAAELSCKQLLVVVSDAAAKAVEDQSFIVETYGNASAMYVTDLSAQLATPTNITAATGIVLSGVTHTGAVIPTVSAVTGLTAANLDATVSSRMATYTQPTGFLAATFPAGTVANTTNITAGTITTATNLTNLPATAALEATLTAMKGATFAGATDSLEAIRDRGDAAWITATGFATPTNITAATGIVLSGVTHTGAVIPTVSTLTGHTAQTGDSFARLGAPAGASVSADIAAVKAETASIQTDTNDLQTQVGTAGAGLTNITLNAASIDLVWDEPTAGHATAGTTGKALTDAGSAGDPWSTALPGAYGAGTAGKIVGDNVNAPIATVDTVVDAIKAKTDSLTFTQAGHVDANVQRINDVTIIGDGSATPFNV